jgi:uncharacterized protein YifN (PemK superfamily)
VKKLLSTWLIATAAAISRTRAQDSMVKEYDKNMALNVMYRRNNVGIKSTVLWLRTYMINSLSRNSLHPIRSSYTLFSLLNSKNQVERLMFSAVLL